MTKSLVDRLQTIWDNIRRGTNEPYSWFILPPHRIDPFVSQEVRFQENKHYFQLRVNQIFLKYDREWFVRYDPSIMVISEFLYDKEYVAVPFLIGPSLFESKGMQISAGSILADTRVAGLHPFRGGRLILRLVLYKTQRDNSVRQLLELLENTAGAIDYSTALSQYLKIAGAVVSGVEGLIGLGKTIPVMALSKEFDLTAGDDFKESYVIVINRPEQDVDLEKMWVVNNKLYVGERRDNLVPYSESDFVLLSLRRATERDDIDQLPFYPLWEQALKDATIPEDAHWKLAKASLASLYQAMVLSPDLTETQVTSLRDRFIEVIQKRRREAIELASLGPTQNVEDTAKLRDDGLAILDL